MDKLWQDVRYGFRILRKAPAFSALVVLIVAIGIGAAATIFSIVESALLWNENPNVDRWVVVRSFFPRQNLREFHFSSPEYFDFKSLTDVFESVGAASGFNATMFVDGMPQFMQGTYVTSDMIPMTATTPMFGRAFTADDDKPGAPLTTVLTYETWQNRFHGDANILGKNIRINDQHYTVIGIMPPHYGLWGGELYVPFQLSPANGDRSRRQLRVVALIRKGVTPQQADARLNQFAITMARDHAVTNPEYRDMQLATWNIKEAVVGGVKPVLLILMGVVGLVIVISCANIGNLLMARASGRRREMALRAALGAARMRVVRQLLTESLMLSLAGGVAGALLAAWGVPAAVALVGLNQLPNASHNPPHLDTGALLLALAAATLMGVMFGLAPVVHTVSGDLARAIREGGLQSGSSRAGKWARNALVVSQIALAMIVLAGAGLMIRTYRELLHLDIGYNAHNALTAQIALPGDKYPTGEKVTAFYRDLLERLHSSPGIEGAAVATGRPMMDRVVDLASQDFSLPGHEGDKDMPNANLRVISPGYFGVAGIRLLRGRGFTDGDSPLTEPVAIVNETMARLFWPKQDAVGQSIRLGAHYSSEPDASAGRWVKIVGVVSDARQVRYVEVPIRQEILFPLAQRPDLARGATLMVRSRLSTDAVTTAVRQAAAAVDPDRPIFDVITLEQAVAESFATRRLATVLLGFFAAIAISLASVGLYAIIAFMVTQRTRDIGIRMALGARPSDVLRMTLGEGWRLAVAGLLAGIAGALVAARLMRSLVFDVSTTDPATFAATAALLALIALLASYVPARRATRIDPMIALRYE
jgi:predicted permease